jgi:hypothetical protein
MKQLGLSTPLFVKKPKRTRRQQFLQEMEQVVPWSLWERRIAPHYPTAGRGRRPFALATLLRIHLMQQWFGYSDPAMEEALHDMPLLREFAGLDAGEEAMPDETTILKFRRLLERHQLAQTLFDETAALLAEKGLLLRQGTIVDATLIAAPAVHQEPPSETGCRDEFDQERQQLLLRYEGAHWGRCRVGFGAYRGDYHGEGGGWDHDRCLAARRIKSRGRRPGLYPQGPQSSHRTSGKRAGLGFSVQAQERRGFIGGASPLQPHAGIMACRGRTPI